MREMKDSGVPWIGEIPKEWFMDKMNRICLVITDYVASGSFADLAANVTYLDSPNYAMLVRTADVSGKGYNLKPVFVSESSYNFLRNSNLFGGELLLPNIGGVGDVYIVPKLYEHMTLAPNAIMVRTKLVDRYYYYYFSCEAGRRSILSISGSTAQQKFNKTDFRQIRACVPPLKEQQRIADFLDVKCSEIDSILEQTKASIEEYKALKKSVITDAVTKGLREKRQMKDSGSIWFSNIPADWGFKRIKYLFRIEKRIAGETGHTVLAKTQKGVVPKNMDYGNGQFAEDYSNYQLVYPGDFAMNHMDLLTGWVDISRYSGVTSPDYRVFTIIDNAICHPAYYLYFMQMCYLDKIFYGLGQGVSGMGRWRLQADKFLNFQVPVPPIKEQQEIASYLDEKCSTIDSLIASKEALIGELEAYKKSLIYEYVTGKKEV